MKNVEVHSQNKKNQYVEQEVRNEKRRGKLVAILGQNKAVFQRKVRPENKQFFFCKYTQRI